MSSSSEGVCTVEGLSDVAYDRFEAIAAPVEIEAGRFKTKEEREVESDGFEAPCRLLGPGLARGRSGVEFDVSGSI